MIVHYSNVRMIVCVAKKSARLKLNDCVKSVVWPAVAVATVRDVM